MPVHFEEGGREPIRTEPQLWLDLVGIVSGPNAAEYQRGKRTSYAAIGLTTLWGELAWVAVHDSLTEDGHFRLSVKWRPVDFNDTELIPDSIIMGGGVIIQEPPDPTVDKAHEIARADYVLDNTTFGDLNPDVTRQVAGLWGFIPVE